MPNNIMPNNDIIQFPASKTYTYNFGSNALSETQFSPRFKVIEGGKERGLNNIVNRGISKARNYPYGAKLAQQLQPERLMDEFIGLPVSRYMGLIEATKTSQTLNKLPLGRFLSYGARVNFAAYLGITFAFYAGKKGWKVFKDVFFGGGDGEVPLEDVEEAQEECVSFQEALDEAYEGLEDLKLGPISMTYTNSGFCDGSGRIGRTGDDFEREIATVDIQGKFSHFSVIAYSYRGYRYATDHDGTQGTGIDPVMDQAFGWL